MEDDILDGHTAVVVGKVLVVVGMQGRPKD